MASALWEVTAAREAEALILELGIKALPVCPFAIARELDIDVKPLPAGTHRGVSGMLLHFDGCFGILYATYIDNDGFKRLSVGHEIGHYRLPGHPESVLHNDAHTSYAGFVSKDRHELEADHFAAALLMPERLFDSAMDKAGSGLDAIVNVSGQCITSLTATSIRYAQRTPDAAAIVVSAGQSIEYCFMSDSLREVHGLDWIRKGSAVPRSSVTAAFNAKPENIARAERADGESTLQDWFGGDLDVELTEEVAGLGDYGKTLTVLTASDLPDAEEIEEEENLSESWTPRFHR
ncbi:MAG: ImmA/IrrE family metallo-endopeptidase [Reyranella sp.]